MSVTRLNCPTCQTAIECSDKFPARPFCSVRCQQIDFVGWADEEFTIPEAPSLNGKFNPALLDPKLFDPALFDMSLFDADSADGKLIDPDAVSDDFSDIDNY